MGRASFRQRFKGILSAVAYGLISITITFFNKSVFSVYSFEGAVTLILGQMTFCIVFLTLVKALGLVEMRDFDTAVAKEVAPLVFFFVGMAVSGVAALRFVNIPLYSCLRRAATLCVIVLDRLILGKVAPRGEVVSVVFMMVGAIVAYWGDLTFSAPGYFLIAINCFITAGYLVLIAKTSKSTKLNSFEMMYYNNVVAYPFILTLGLFMEYDYVVSFTYLRDSGFMFVFGMSCVQAFLLNYTIFLCSTINSPLTTSVTGQVKNIGTTILGFFTFGDVVPTLFLIIGVTISSLASVYYAFLKYLQKQGRSPTATYVGLKTLPK